MYIYSYIKNLEKDIKIIKKLNTKKSFSKKKKNYCKLNSNVKRERLACK